jgi:hypothetical protein
LYRTKTAYPGVPGDIEGIWETKRKREGHDLFKRPLKKKASHKEKNPGHTQT